MPDPIPPTAGEARGQRRGTSQRLDPYGIYGTRSAGRVRAAKRRRTLQMMGLAAGAMVLLAIPFALLRMPRSRSLGGQRRVVLPLQPAAPAAWTTAQGGQFLVPTEAGQLLAVKGATGAANIAFTTPSPLRVQPLVVADIAYVPAEDGLLYALRYSTGQIVWRFKVGGAIVARPAALKLAQPLPSTVPSMAPMTPLVPAGSAPLSPAARPLPSPSRGARPRLATPTVEIAVLPAPAVRVPTAPVPTIQPSTPGPAPGATTPVVTPEPVPTPIPLPQTLIFAANDEGLVAAIDAATGLAVWRRELAGPIGNALTVTTLPTGEPLVLVPTLAGVASRGGLWCLDARGGAVRWRFPQRAAGLAPFVAAPAVGEIKPAGAWRVYAGDDTGAVYCLDLKTGARQWKTYVPPTSANAVALLRGEPLFKQYQWGARVFVGSNDGRLHALNAATGQVLWSFRAPGAIGARPQAVRLERAGGVRDLLAVGSDGGAVLLDARNGRVAAQLPSAGGVLGAPVWVGEDLLLLTAGGSLHSFSLRNLQ